MSNDVGTTFVHVHPWFYTADILDLAILYGLQMQINCSKVLHHLMWAKVFFTGSLFDLLLTCPRILREVFQTFQQLMNTQLQYDLPICEGALLRDR